MSYALRLSKPFLKSLKSLDQSTVRRIHHRLKELSQNPFDPRISGVVEMGAGERKSRVGGWRLFFEVDEANRCIEVLAVRPRGRAYKDM